MRTFHRPLLAEVADAGLGNVHANPRCHATEDDIPSTFDSCAVNTVELNLTDCIGNFQDMDYRAPYIPMSGDEDLIFSASPVPLTHSQDDEQRWVSILREIYWQPVTDAFHMP